MNPPRYILYTRVSTVAQDDNNSHESQLAALQKHVAQKGGLIVGVQRETASGGAYLGRPGIRAALDSLERDEADILACFDFSRYSRDEEHQQAMMNRVERGGKRIEFTNMELARDEEGQLTPESRLMFGVSGSFASYHRAKIRADTMRGAKASAEKGIQPRRKPPYGYHIVTKADVLAGRYEAALLGRYLIIEEEATLVREMFERRAQGESCEAICRDLHRRGITTRRGAVFTPSSLSKIFSNTVYRGQARYGRTRRVRDERRLDQGFVNDFSYKIRPTSEITFIAVPAIVSPQIYQAVSNLDVPKGVLGDKRARFLLSSVLRCPRCGSPMGGKHQKRSARGKAGRTGRPRRGEAAPVKSGVIVGQVSGAKVGHELCSALRQFPA